MWIYSSSPCQVRLDLVPWQQANCAVLSSCGVKFLLEGILKLELFHLCRSVNKYLWTVGGLLLSVQTDKYVFPLIWEREAPISTPITRHCPCTVRLSFTGFVDYLDTLRTSKAGYLVKSIKGRLVSQFSLALLLDHLFVALHISLRGGQVTKPKKIVTLTQKYTVLCSNYH